MWRKAGPKKGRKGKCSVSTAFTVTFPEHVQILDSAIYCFVLYFFYRKLANIQSLCTVWVTNSCIWIQLLKNSNNKNVNSFFNHTIENGDKVLCKKTKTKQNRIIHTYQSCLILWQDTLSYAEENGPMCPLSNVDCYYVLNGCSKIKSRGQELPFLKACRNYDQMDFPSICAGLTCPICIRSRSENYLLPFLSV